MTLISRLERMWMANINSLAANVLQHSPGDMDHKDFMQYFAWLSPSDGVMTKSEFLFWHAHVRKTRDLERANWRTFIADLGLINRESLDRVGRSDYSKIVRNDVEI